MIAGKEFLSLTVVVALTVLLLTIPCSLAAPPDLTAGGTPNNTRTTNLGPTGMRGWIYHVNSGGRRGDTSESRQISCTPWTAVRRPTGCWPRMT